MLPPLHASQWRHATVTEQGHRKKVDKHENLAPDPVVTEKMRATCANPNYSKSQGPHGQLDLNEVYRQWWIQGFNSGWKSSLYPA